MRENSGSTLVEAIAPATPSTRVDGVQAESLIALEAAIAELGLLYAAARQFRELHEAAERDLLPQLNRLSRRLRAATRRDQLAQPELDEASREIIGVALQWRGALENLRRSAAYQEALHAFAANDQEALRRILPMLLRGITAIDTPSAPVYFEFSASRRRRSGTTPFLTPATCAEQISDLRNRGIEPESSGKEWWERDLPPLECSGTMDLLESVIALRVDHLPATLFTSEAGTGLMLFSPRLQASFAVVVAATPNDEWWEANALPYPQFRAELLERLHSAGVTTAER